MESHNLEHGFVESRQGWANDILFRVLFRTSINRPTSLPFRCTGESAVDHATLSIINNQNDIAKCTSLIPILLSGRSHGAGDLFARFISTPTRRQFHIPLNDRTECTHCFRLAFAWFYRVIRSLWFALAHSHTHTCTRSSVHVATSQANVRAKRWTWIACKMSSAPLVAANVVAWTNGP